MNGELYRIITVKDCYIRYNLKVDEINVSSSIDTGDGKGQ